MFRINYYKRVISLIVILFISVICVTKGAFAQQVGSNIVRDSSSLEKLSLDKGIDSSKLLWDKAIKAYELSNWQEAIDAWEAIKPRSFALCYNLSNAYYKNGQIAKAVLYAERAMKINPQNEDIKYNLNYINTELVDKIDQIPQFWLKLALFDLINHFSSDFWAYTALFFIALLLSLVVYFSLKHNFTSMRLFFIGFLLLIALSSYLISFWQLSNYDDSTAIIMSKTAVVRSAPESVNSKELFILHEGTKVYVSKESGQWANIVLADGRQGWLPKSKFEMVLDTNN